MKRSFFHMVQILLSADTRINFIPIKPNGNCYTAMATDILRTLDPMNQNPHERFSIIGKLVAQKFSKQTNMQTRDTCHYLVKT